MHSYLTPQSVKDRVLRRQGKLLSHETIDAGRTALVVVDMQNYFVAEGFAAEVPEAREIVPNINRMAKALRSAGGTVVWIQTTAVGALEQWGNHHKHMLTPDRVDKRLTQLDENHEGFKVYPKLEALPTDLRVKKIKYSAFIAGSSDIDAQLKARGIETLLVTGTVTNVCCESTARDAFFRDFKVIFLTDGNGTFDHPDVGWGAFPATDVQAHTLTNIRMYFGEVAGIDEVSERIRASAGDTE